MLPTAAADVYMLQWYPCLLRAVEPVAHPQSLGECLLLVLLGQQPSIVVRNFGRGVLKHIVSKREDIYEEVVVAVFHLQNVVGIGVYRGTMLSESCDVDVKPGCHVDPPGIDRVHRIRMIFEVVRIDV